MEKFDLRTKEPDGAVLVVLGDLELELIREDWKYRNGVIGIRTIIGLLIFLRYDLHIIKYSSFKSAVQRV